MLSLQNFQSAVSVLGGGPAAKPRTALLRAWTEPHRRYHTLQHLEECLELAQARATDFSPIEQAHLTLALWFHDAVYDTHGSDNERRSATLAMTELTKVGVPAEHCARIAQLVLATEHDAASAPAEDPLTQLLIDIDLAILGASAARFAEYEGQIRQEYSWVPDTVYAAGRKKVLDHFRSRAKAPAMLFKTPAGGVLLPQARFNLGLAA